MKWDEDADKAHEMLPIPPMMGPYARIQSEKIARHRGLDRVTVDVVRETENVYRAIGKMETEYGVTVVTPSPEEQAKMREKAMVVWDQAAAAGPRCAEAVDLYKAYMRDLGLIK